jgi:hypothetical protein
LVSLVLLVALGLAEAVGESVALVAGAALALGGGAAVGVYAGGVAEEGPCGAGEAVAVVGVVGGAEGGDEDTAVEVGEGVGGEALKAEGVIARVPLGTVRVVRRLS